MLFPFSVNDIISREPADTRRRECTIREPADTRRRECTIRKPADTRRRECTIREPVRYAQAGMHHPGTGQYAESGTGICIKTAISQTG